MTENRKLLLGIGAIFLVIMLACLRAASETGLWRELTITAVFSAVMAVGVYLLLRDKHQ